MKTWHWLALGAVGVFALMSKNKTLYVSRGGTSTMVTTDFQQDTAVSATANAKPINVPTLTSDLLYPESVGWRL